MSVLKTRLSIPGTRRSGKGVSPVLATVLIVMVVISLSGAFLVFTQSTATSLTESGQESQERLQAELDARPVIEGVSNNQLFLRNAGTDNITDASMTMFIADRVVEHSLPSEIAPNTVGTVNIEEPWAVEYGEHNLRVSVGSVSDSVRVKMVKPPGNVGEWRYDDGSRLTAIDTSGMGHHASLQGGNTSNADGDTPPTWTDGVIGGALEFDGVDDWVNSPVSSPDFDTKYGPSTVSLLFRPDAVGGLQRLSVDGCPEWSIYISGNDLTGFIYGDTSGGSVTSGEWHHVVFQHETPPGFDGSTTETTTRRVYLNGELQGETTIDMPDGNGYVETLGIGGKMTGGGCSVDDMFDGAVDEVRVYNEGYSFNELYEVKNA